MESQTVDSRIREKAKVCLNKTRPQSVPTNEDREKKQSKREIVSSSRDLRKIYP